MAPIRTTQKNSKPFQTLKDRQDFLRAGKSGRKWISPGVIVQAAPNELGEMRIGYTVTKKIDKRAVRRNRIKRRLRAAAADIMPHQARPGDYVLIGRAETASRPYADLCRDLAWCVRKMGLGSRLNFKETLMGENSIFNAETTEAQRSQRIK